MPWHYTTDHAASSYRIPVLVDEAGNAYGPADLLTAAQAAEVLGVSRRRVLTLIKDGRLPGRKLGSRYVLQVSDVTGFERLPVGWKPGRKRNAP